ncbi:hypothetical protein GCM10009785_01240 [Brooklawnia cerclae]|uniref:Outer membrane murein-binding lipoprotein Lpp n=1 Tax=Brooklawnia cerclae TaxID=349934 RepID=A0ABX0SD01_9ACTN|nr:hypothetical protein [Brooklawnia cerclae]NIH56283.1 outer membrane murein-binding lipoprotein Lpp [Brooklawnia cerclae]
MPTTIVNPEALFAGAVAATASQARLHSMAERADQLMAERDQLADQLTRVAHEIALARRNPDRIDPVDAALIAFSRIEGIVIEDPSPAPRRAMGPAAQQLDDLACDMRATRVPAHRAEAEGTGR